MTFRTKSPPQQGSIVATLTEHAVAIRALGKQTVKNIIEIGQRLVDCRDNHLDHGQWLPWLEREFGWSRQTADNFIHVYEARTKLPKFGNLDLPVSALYLLAAPSTPTEAVEEIAERAEAGEPVSVAEVKNVIDAAKGEQPARKRSPRNMVRNGIRRAMKLGPDVMAKIKGTSLDSAAEMDALILLNRGVPEGEHTEIVKQFVAAVEAGKQVSAVKYIDSGAALRREDIGPVSTAESALKDAEIEKLRSSKRSLEQNRRARERGRGAED